MHSKSLELCSRNSKTSHAQIKEGLLAHIYICYKINKNSQFSPNEHRFKTPAFWLLLPYTLFFVPVLMADIIHNGPSPLCCLGVQSKSDMTGQMKPI